MWPWPGCGKWHCASVSASVKWGYWQHTSHLVLVRVRWVVVQNMLQTVTGAWEVLCVSNPNVNELIIELINTKQVRQHLGTWVFNGIQWYSKQLGTVPHAKECSMLAMNNLGTWATLFLWTVFYDLDLILPKLQGTILHFTSFFSSLVFREERPNPSLRSERMLRHCEVLGNCWYRTSTKGPILGFSDFNFLPHVFPRICWVSNLGALYTFKNLHSLLQVEHPEYENPKSEMLQTPQLFEHWNDATNGKFYTQPLAIDHDQNFYVLRVLYNTAFRSWV